MSRKEHWEKVYLEKSPLEVSWYQSIPALSLQFIAATGIDKDAAILDVGGGASLLVDHLAEQGYRSLAVLDISGKALAIAQTRLGEKAQQIQWFERDVLDFESHHPFALWHDRAVFHFLSTEAEQMRYVESLKRNLQHGGHFILATFGINGPTKCSNLDTCQYDAKRIQTILGTSFRLVEEAEDHHITPFNTEQKFAWFRFIYQH